MRKLVVSEFISLDGVIEAPHMWHFPFITDDMNEHNVAEVNNSDIFLYGRNTFEEFASFWPTTSNNEYGIGDKLNFTEKYVVSKTLQSADWQNTTILRSVEDVANLKAQGDGKIGMTGSAGLVKSLMEARLIDQFDLLVHPIVVGQGKRLFPEGVAKTPLKLLGTRSFNGGVVLMSFQPAD